jgi:hypothetical protein
LCFHMSGPRDWDTTRRARRVIGVAERPGSKLANSSWRGIAPTHALCFSALILFLLPSEAQHTEEPNRGSTPGNSGHSTARYSLALPLTSPHLMDPAAAAAARTRTAGRTTGFCQLPALGPVRLAARARSISHHLHLCDAIRICKLNNKPLSLRQCAPASQTQSHACCNLIAAGSSLARRFARSLKSTHTTTEPCSSLGCHLVSAVSYCSHLPVFFFAWLTDI